MTQVKRLARFIPQPLLLSVRSAWRKVRGNPEFKILRLLADPKKLAVDVGANHGVYTVLLGQAANGCAAFEPNPRIAAAAQERVAAAGLTNVHVHAIALSDVDGEVTFRVPIVNGQESDALATIEPDNDLGDAEVRLLSVPCRRLDSLELATVGVMKIDAEGHEMAILEGARALIQRDLPAVMIEAEERHKSGSVRWVEQYFSAFGYRGFFLMGRQLVSMTEFATDVHQNLANLEGGTVRLDVNYVNNFIFIADPHRMGLMQRICDSGRSL